MNPENPNNIEDTEKILKSLSGSSTFKVLTESGDSIITENGGNLVTFISIEFSPSGLVQIYGSFYSVNEYHKYSCRPSGMVYTYGTAESILKYKIILSYKATGSKVVGGSAECIVRPRRSYNPKGDYVVVSGSSTFFRKFVYSASVTIVSSGTSVPFIRKYDYFPTGQMIVSNVLRYKFLAKYTAQAGDKSIGGEATSVFRIVFRRVTIQLTLSNITYAKLLRMHIGSGSINTSGTSRSTKPIIKYSPQDGVVSSATDSDIKPVIRFTRRSIILLTASGNANLSFVKVQSGIGVIFVAGSSTSKITQLHSILDANISIEGGITSVKYLGKYDKSFEFTLSNSLDRRLVYYYNPPESPIVSNSAFPYADVIGKTIVFNVTGLSTGSSIWGTDTYTVDSDLRLVAVHSGILNDGENGNIAIEIADGQDLYAGSVRNGISSKDWNSNTYGKSIIAYPLSFSVFGSVSIGTFYEFSATGSVQISSQATCVLRPVVIVGDSEISTSGSSSNNTIRFVYLAEYSAFLSGEAQDVKYSIAAICPLFISGSAEQIYKYRYFSSFTGQIEISSTIYGGSTSVYPTFIIGGSSKSIIIRKFDSQGQIDITSTREEFVRNRILYATEGFVEIVCDNIYYPFEATYNFDLECNWIVGGSGSPDFTRDFSSTWNTYSENYYWYRVIFCGNADQVVSTCDGIYLQNSESPTHTKKIYRTANPPENEFVSSLAKSRPSNSCRSLYQNHIANPSCGSNSMSLITGVLARNISEVCQILKNPRVGPPPNDSCFKLLSIKKYVQPVDEDGNPIYSELIDQEFCNSPDCLEFCIDFDFTKEVDTPNTCNNSFEFSMSIAENIFSFPPETDYFPGSIVLSGSSKPLFYWLNPDGQQISITNYNYELTCTNYYYESSFVLELSNSGYHAPSIEPMVLESGESLLLEQILDTIDLESSVYETEDGILDLREISNVVVSNIIMPSIVQLSIGGSSSVIQKYRTHICQDNVIDFNGENQALLRMSYTGNPRYAYFKFEGSSIYSYRRSYSYASIVKIQIESNVQLISSSFYHEFINELDISSGRVELISPSIQYSMDGYISVYSTDQRVGRLYVACEDSCEMEIEGSAECKMTHRSPGVSSLNISGYAGTSSPYYSYDAILEANAQSAAILYFNNIGLLVSEIEANANVYDVVFDSAVSNFSQLTANTSRINICGCLSLNQNLSLSHNLVSAGILSDFLLRNNYSFSDTVNLRYNSNQNSWFSSINLRGRGLDAESIEEWLLMFNLSCNNIIDGDSNDNYYLKFNFFSRRVNVTSTLSWITNVNTNIVPSSVCQNGNLSTRIILNTSTQSVFVDNTFSPFSGILDNIGLFKNTYWNDKVNCAKARKDKLGRGRRDAFSFCEIVGPFPEFRINYPTDPVMDKISIPVAEQIIL